eukprot:TRINITY_DN1036_c0_g1_i2.p1 TRINITY_DN1036_c0_g1~~TRINITY_DN1036_c0_g1_i2.p1  ORF type:complete len:637 (+),score=146.79 TRINITY_DN1036_c0_g1_i2:1607-3517(+)
MTITPTSPEMKNLVKKFIEGRGEESEPLQSQFLHYMLALLLSADTYLEEQSLVALFWDCGCTYDALVDLANESSTSLQEQIESYFDEAEMFPGYIPFAPEKLLVDELQADALPVSKMAATAALGSFVNRLDQFKSVTLTVPKPPTSPDSTPSIPESDEPSSSSPPTRPERAHERERSSDKRVQLKRIGSVGGIGATNKKLVSTASSSSSGNPIPALPLASASSDSPMNPPSTDVVTKKSSAVKFTLPEPALKPGLKPAPSLLPKQRKKMRKKPLVPLSRGTLTVAHTGMNELKKFQRLRLPGLAADLGRSFTEIRKFLTLLKDKMGPTTDSVAFYKCLGSYLGVPKATFSDLESLGVNSLASHNTEGFITHIKKTNRRVWKWVQGVHAFGVGPDVVKKVELIHTHFLFYDKATTVVAAAVAFRAEESTPQVAGGEASKAKATPEQEEAASPTPLLVPPSELTPKTFSKRPVPALSPVQVSASTTPSRVIEALLGDFDGLLEFLNSMWKFSDGIIDNEIEQRTARGVELSEDWIYLLSQRILEIEQAETLSVSYSRRIQFFSVWKQFLEVTAAHQGQMDAMQSFQLGGMNFESSKTLASLKFRSDNRSMESLNYIPANSKKKPRKKSDASKKGAGQL